MLCVIFRVPFRAVRLVGHLLEIRVLQESRKTQGKNKPIGSLSNNVFERRTSTGSGLFSFFDGGFAQIFSQIASIIVKKLRNSNFISSRHVKRENTSLPVVVRRSKTSLLKLPNILLITSFFPERETTNLSIKSTSSFSSFVRQTQIMIYGQQRMSHLRESRLKNLIRFLTMFGILQTILTNFNFEKQMIQLLQVCFMAS